MAIERAQEVLAAYIEELKSDLARSEEVLAALRDGTAGEDVIVTKGKEE